MNSEMSDHQILVTMNLHTTNDDLIEAVNRSRIIPGLLIGEALIEMVEYEEMEVKDDARP